MMNINNSVLSDQDNSLWYTDYTWHSNTTLYSIGYRDRLILSGWGLLLCILGGVGNVLLLSGLYFSRFRVDITSHWFLSNMAVSDVLYVVVIVVPSLLTNLANKWLLGDAVCGLTASLRMVLSIIHLLSLTLLSLTKLFRCTFPLRAVYTELGLCSGTLTTLLMWTISFVPLGVNYALKRPYAFDPNLSRYLNSSSIVYFNQISALSPL